MKKKEIIRFIIGGNFVDGTRFEAGDEVPATVTVKEMRALVELEAVEPKMTEMAEEDGE